MSTRPTHLPFAVALALATFTAAPAQQVENGVPTRAPTTSTPTPPPYDPDHAAAPVATAVRIDVPITIDGRLDEAPWRTAPAVTDFWQADPDEGIAVSEPTEVRFLYDDEALYVGAWLWDHDGVIPRRLGRRDTQMQDVDLFAVHLDSYHSHRSSYRFAVNPTGTIRDQLSGATGGLAGGDGSWNPIWEVKTRIDDRGWYAEMKIPFSQLRFSRADVQVWGLQLERKLRPVQENTVWFFTPKDRPQGQIRFGHLVGIHGIKPGRKLEVLPYAGGRAEYVTYPRNASVAFANPFRTGSDYFGYAGLDLKYRVTSNLTLDGTVNPDFGQVEVDPAVINLTAYETRFAEKRPFFIEGAEIFDFGEGVSQLLYSRRIGRPPHGVVPGESAYSLTPGATTILGAGKLSGKTLSGWSLAALDAVTGEETSRWMSTAGAERSVQVEPRSNYFAGRARREMRSGQSTLGGIVTTVHRDLSGSPLEATLHRDAYTAGLDFNHEFRQRAWEVSGSFSPSWVRGSSAALLATQRTSTRYYQRPDADYLEVDSSATSLFGYSTNLLLRKQDGRWHLDAAASAVSPGYEVNDLGFQTIADRWGVRATLGYVQTRRGPYFRNWNLGVSPDLAWNYGGDLITQTYGLSGGAQLPNFATFNGRAFLFPSKLNQRLTRGGPLARDPTGWSSSFSFATDSRSRVTSRFGLDLSADRSGAWLRSGNFSLQFKAAEQLDVSLQPTFTRSRSRAQYVTSVADATATSTFGRRYVFADIEQSTLSLDARVNFTLTPRVSLELFAQPFLSSGDYDNLKELAAPGTFDFLRYGADAGTIGAIDGGRRFSVDPDGPGPGRAFRVDNRDFNVRSLRSNAVFRWEWRPGSTLYLVWQQSRQGTLAGSDALQTQDRVGDFRFGRDAGELFGLRADNILLIKASYWLNP